MPPHSSLRRRAARTALVLAAAIAAVASAPPARAAELGQAVLQPHEPTAAPLRWEGVHAGLRLVRPRATTPFARVTMAARSGRFWIFRSPRPVRVTDTGTGNAPGVAPVWAYQLLDPCGCWPPGAYGFAPGVVVPHPYQRYAGGPA